MSAAASAARSASNIPTSPTPSWRRRPQTIAATGAETLLAGDLGCLMNMAGKLKREGRATKSRHVAEVLAGMTDEPAIGEASEMSERTARLRLRRASGRCVAPSPPPSAQRPRSTRPASTTVLLHRAPTTPRISQTHPGQRVQRDRRLSSIEFEANSWSCVSPTRCAAARTIRLRGDCYDEIEGGFLCHRLHQRRAARPSERDLQDPLVGRTRTRSTSSTTRPA